MALLFDDILVPGLPLEQLCPVSDWLFLRTKKVPMTHLILVVISSMTNLTIPVKLPWIFPGAPLIFQLGSQKYPG